MAKKSKQMRAALEKIDSTKAYSVEEAVALAQETNFAKFDATVEVSYNLNIDVKKADQQIRGAMVLPNGTGKTQRVLVFARGAKAEEAKAAIDKLFVKLWNQGVSTKDKVTMYLTPWFYSLFQNKLIELKTNNDELIAQGVLGLYNNAKVKMTNNAYNDGTDDYIIVKTSKAFAYCNGIDKLKPYEPEKGFAEAVKGLNTYGGKMVRPKECAVLRCHQK